MADHRDFLGAIVNLGVTRDGIGDILVQGERGAQVLVDPVMAEFLAGSLTSVRSVKVKVRPIPLEELAVRPAKTKDVSTVEASLRLDSVASAGMGMSRSKMSAAIKSGLVLVNWKAASSGTTNVREGDIVTVRGKGRVEIGDITVTKKGRYKINMCRTT
ncbi:RNA-binding S4 [Ectocarpus siliculosus]|uniref:RNA-binding S4 n=1 Tax=Ectocarpus siliculosus TaxID=2880 RepID=D7FH66_ECTSI|nr:RNA-binding S4 [Ectocarpus siliculosus]|eukprot:CBJ28441.1 RNA-binding S4 [Ectocarpus siliculosus]